MPQDRFTAATLSVEIDQLRDERNRLANLVGGYVIGGADVPVGLRLALRNARIALSDAVHDKMLANSGVLPETIAAQRDGRLPAPTRGPLSRRPL